MQQMFSTLARMSISAGLLVLVVLALRALLRRAPRRVICLLWALVALRLICPIQIEWRASLMPPTETVMQTVREMPQIFLPAQDAPTDVEANPEPTGSAPDLSNVLSRIWFAGMIGMLAWAVWSDLRLRQRLCAAIRIRDNIWLCDEIDTPFVLGIFAPRIYLPSALDAAQTSSILAHERAHIARGDHWWKPLGWLFLSVYWFQPMLWLGYVLFCRDLELACDERAVRGLDREGLAAYSEALLRCSVPRHTALTFPVAFGEVGVKTRVKAVLTYKKPTFWLAALTVLALIVAAVFFLTSRPAEESFVDYFEQYRANVLDGDAQAASALRWFENQTKRQMYLDNFQTPEAFTVSEQTQINDDLWVFSCEEQLPELPSGLIYQFVGRSGGRLWVYGNVNQIPEAISAGLDRSLYDYHEDENVMNADEDEQLKALEQADAKALIEAFPNTDGAYAELVVARLAEYYRADPEGVEKLIDENTLTEQQKNALLTGIDLALQTD